VSAEYRGRRIGGISNLTTFSFHPVKNMTTGEGGMVTTNSDELVDLLRAYRAHGVVADPEKRYGKDGGYFYEQAHLGHRFHMTEMQAALGVCQLEKLDRFQERRGELVRLYDRELATLSGVDTPVVRPYVKHSWHLYTIELAGKEWEGRRDEVFAAMRAENIGVNVHYIPVHYHPYYREKFGYRKGAFPRAERAFRRILTLPLFPKMTDDDARDVIRGLEKVMAGLKRRHRGAKHLPGKS
jgi:dTDP-4-amino-4,6-dideoxygalactose transaminase